MSEPADSPGILSYGRPDPALARWGRRVPRPSALTVVLVLLAAAAARWFWVDHAAWVASDALPTAFDTLAGRLSADGRRVVVVAPGASPWGGMPSRADNPVGPVAVCDVATGAVVRTFGNADDYTADVRLSPDASRLLTVGGTAHITTTRSGSGVTRFGTFSGPGQAVHL